MKDYIPELSEVRMVRRAPDAPLAFSAEDAVYLEHALRAVETAFGLDAFPGQPFGALPARALLKTLIDWWRGLEPETADQRDAHGRLPSAIRLIDTISAWTEESTGRTRGWRDRRLGPGSHFG
jgi:hypothetical protein